MILRKIFPFLDWIKGYNGKLFQGDLSAGLTVGVMLIPQGMAYAMIAGLPPIYGLYASTLPLIIYALMGTSRQLAVGPVAMVSLLTASGISTLAEQGTDVFIQYAIVLALMVGIIQFLLGLFRLGFLVNFLSHPVISGFTSAAALIIGLSQLQHLIGVKLPRSHHIHVILQEAFKAWPSINGLTLLIGLMGIALILIMKKYFKSIPGQLIAVIFGILVVWGAGLTDHGVLVLGEVPKGLPKIGVPEFTMELVQDLFPIALAISLVSFMESIAVAKAIQARHKNYKVIPNQELISLGLANIGGSFFQSFPVTGGFSRTAVNDQAGAKTGLAAIISALLIVLTLLFLTPLFYYLPKAILASVIMVAVFGLIDYQEAKHLWHSNKTDFFMLITTFVATLSLGIEQGIGIGVILSLTLLIFKTTRPHIAILGKVPNSRFYRNTDRFDNLEVRPDIMILRFDAQLYFANINYFSSKIDEFVEQKGKGLKLIIINAESINNMDSSAVKAVEDIVMDYRAQGIGFAFASVKGPVRDAMSKAHLIEKIGENYFYMSIQDAIDDFDKASGQKFDGYVTQANS
jgi:SulP family sulfate permease